MKNIKICLLIGALLCGCAAPTPEKPEKSEDKTTQKQEINLEKNVKGLELDKLYMEVKTKGNDFLKGITYDKKVVKEVLVDTSNVNYEKEGTYEIVYTIVPVDSKMDSVEKKVQIEVVSHERAEELKKEGHNVITQETEKEDSEKEDEEESKEEEQKPVENPDNDNTGNVASGNNGGTGSNSNSGNTGSTSNTGSNTSKPSTGGNSNQGSQKPSTPTHTHNWVQQYTTVHHAEKGHNEQYVIKEAWTESVPIYENKIRSICNTCGADITGFASEHAKQHVLNGENGAHHTEVVQVQTGTNTINHPAEYGTRYVVDQAAYDEQVPAGFKCSCGATK